MTRNAVPAAWLLALLLALALVPSPTAAEGLPPVHTQVFSDCNDVGDAGNTFAEARPLWADEVDCYGWLTPADPEDWYSVFLFEGQSYWLSLFPSAFSLQTDVDVCAYAPDQPDEPLECSKNPLLYGDWLSFHAESTGEYRLQLVLAFGAGPYQFHGDSSPVWRPPPYPDIALTDLTVQKAVVGTDAGSTGLVNPAGRWIVTVTFQNLGEAWGCPEISLSIYGQGLLVPLALSGPQSWGPCLEPGGTGTASLEWRPLGYVGDVRILSSAYLDFDANWENNYRETSTFVLLSGL